MKGLSNVFAIAMIFCAAGMTGEEKDTANTARDERPFEAHYAICHGIGGSIAANPIGFAVDGRQHVAIAAGSAILTFALP
jgi:hypothetical protein